MPWGSCRLDVETQGSPWALPRHLVCVKLTFPHPTSQAGEVVELSHGWVKVRVGGEGGAQVHRFRAKELARRQPQQQQQPPQQPQPQPLPPKKRPLPPPKRGAPSGSSAPSSPAADGRGATKRARAPPDRFQAAAL